MATYGFSLADLQMVTFIQQWHFACWYDEFTDGHFHPTIAFQLFYLQMATFIQQWHFACWYNEFADGHFHPTMVFDYII